METKPYLKSKTIQGAIAITIPFIVMIIGMFGVEITSEETNQFTVALVNLVKAVLGIWGLISIVKGRKQAKKELKGII